MKALYPPFRRRLSAFGLLLLLTLPALAEPPSPDAPILSSSDRFHPAVGANGMVVSREALATEAGRAVLESGGNAVDAAVTVGFVLAVTTPQAGNLGGGGFMLIHSAEGNETVAIDFREKAPRAATRDLFLDEQGNADSEKSRYSHLAVGVPGTVAGLSLALERHGTRSLAETLAPAIELARDGFPVSRDLAFSLRSGADRLKRSGAARDVFFKEDGRPLRAGETLRLPALAETLERIASDGSQAFYEGAIAEALVADMEAHGGLITREDLAAYEAVLREPVRGRYRGFEITSMPPPSSGGVHIVQMLNVLEPIDLAAMGHNSARYVHTLAETMKFAYADRSRHLGDSDFVPVPLDWLTSPAYAAEIRSRLDPERATASESISPGTAPREGEQTTHFSLIDAQGNAVSCTTTVNFSFGNQYLIPELGFFLNNEMDDFSAKPGTPNAYGLIGGEANAIAAEKRMLSSMSPTIVLKDGKPFLIVGSPGGSRIITTTLQVILNIIDHGMNVAEAVSAPRFHHQWLPDRLYYEKDLNPDTRRILENRGHALEAGGRIGNANAIHSHGGYHYGAADPRALSGRARGF